MVALGQNMVTLFGIRISLQIDRDTVDAELWMATLSYCQIGKLVVIRFCRMTVTVTVAGGLTANSLIDSEQRCFSW